MSKARELLEVITSDPKRRDNDPNSFFVDAKKNFMKNRITSASFIWNSLRSSSKQGTS